MFAPAWRDRTADEDPGAPFFNETTKYVVGVDEPSEEWTPSERLGAFDPDAIRKLKDDTDGVIYVSGSGQLVRGLLPRAWSTSCTCSSTRSRWAAVDDCSPRATRPTKLALRGHDVYDNGVVHLSYGPA